MLKLEHTSMYGIYALLCVAGTSFSHHQDNQHHTQERTQHSSPDILWQQGNPTLLQ
jgi:hypothetical protein